MIAFPEHALERMEERGASRHEVRKAIREGEASDARHGRTEFTYTFPFEDEWNAPPLRQQGTDGLRRQRRRGLDRRHRDFPLSLTRYSPCVSASTAN